MAESLLRADKEGILDDLADEVWEEALSLPEPSDQIKEQYKKEAQHLLESMQSQKRSFTKRILYMATGIAASILVIWGSHYYETTMGYPTHHSSSSNNRLRGEERIDPPRWQPNHIKCLLKIRIPFPVYRR